MKNYDSGMWSTLSSEDQLTQKLQAANPQGVADFNASVGRAERQTKRKDQQGWLNDWMSDYGPSAGGKFNSFHQQALEAAARSPHLSHPSMENFNFGNEKGVKFTQRALDSVNANPGKHIKKQWEDSDYGFWDPSKEYSDPQISTQNAPEAPSSPTTDKNNNNNNNNLGNLIGTGLNSGGFEGTGPTMDKQNEEKPEEENNYGTGLNSGGYEGTGPTMDKQNPEWSDAKDKAQAHQAKPKLKDYDNEDGIYNNGDVNRMKELGYTPGQIENYRNQQDADSMSGSQLLKSNKYQGMDRNQTIDDYNVHGVNGQGRGVGQYKKAGWTASDVKALTDEGFTIEDIQGRMQSDHESGNYRYGKKAKSFMNTGKFNSPDAGNDAGNGGGTGDGKKKNKDGANVNMSINAHEEQPDSQNSGQSPGARADWASGVANNAIHGAGADYDIDTAEVRRKTYQNAQNMFDMAAISHQNTYGGIDPNKKRPGFVLPDMPETEKGPDFSSMYKNLMDQMGNYSIN